MGPQDWTENGAQKGGEGLDGGALVLYSFPMRKAMAQGKRWEPSAHQEEEQSQKAKKTKEKTKIKGGIEGTKWKDVDPITYALEKKKLYPFDFLIAHHTLLIALLYIQKKKTCNIQAMLRNPYFLKLLLPCFFFSLLTSTKSQIRHEPLKPFMILIDDCAFLSSSF